MSDHHTNITALIAKTIPAWPPAGRMPGIGIMTRVVPKANVFIGTPDEPADAQTKHAEACSRAGLVQDVHELGKPLPFEKCDIVLTLIASWVDTSPAHPREGRHMLPGELGRFDLREFVANCEASLPEEKRIINPGLTRVQ